MHTSNSQFKRQVMRRVYIVAFTRRFLRPFVVKSALLSVLILAGAVSVSITNVVKNALASSHGDVFNLATFMLRAFFHTELFVQIVLSGIALILVTLVMDTVRNLENRHSLA